MIFKMAAVRHLALLKVKFLLARVVKRLVSGSGFWLVS